jgi:hypothetical protein
MPEHAGTRLPGRSLAEIVGKRALLRTQHLQNGSGHDQKAILIWNYYAAIRS